MHVTFISHTEGLYGANRSLLALLRLSDEFNVEPSVIVRAEGPFTQRLRQMGIPYVTAPLKRWMSKTPWKGPARLAVNVGYTPFLLRKLDTWGTDLIHTNSSVIPNGAILSGLSGRPHVWHVREFGDLDYGLTHDFGRRIFQFGLNRTDALIAVSRAVRQRVLGDVDRPIHVVYNGVVSDEQLHDFKPGSLSGGDDDMPFTFAILGRIQPKKGQEQAIQALARLAQRGVEARLLVAGDGDDEYVRQLRSLCATLDIEQRVDFFGFVQNPFAVYRCSGAVLMCSPHEAMGRVTAEAMACGRAIIGYDQDGTAELVDERENGLLYDGSLSGLVNAMERLAQNPRRARELGRQGWQKAKRCFTEETYAEQVFAIHRKVASTGTAVAQVKGE